MTDKNETPDEADVIAANEKLTQQLADTSAKLKTSEDSIKAIASERDDFKAKLDTATKGSETLQETLTARTKERDDARTEVTALKASNEKLTAEMADFNKRVAADLAKHGIRSTATEPPKQSDKPLTATEQCLAAKGK